MYIEREIEQTIQQALHQGKVVLVTGARQVGKTTTLMRCFENNFDYVSMDNARQRSLAAEDSALFFDSKTFPLIIDEIQRTPELFLPIKEIVDQSEKKGQLILTGSQTYHLMRGVSETLAGRIRIIQMPPLSLRELAHTWGYAGNKDALKPRAYVPKKINAASSLKFNAQAGAARKTSEDTPTIKDAPSYNDASNSATSIWEIIHRGSMPELQDAAINWDAFYSDYVSTYLERDVRDLISVKDETKFYNFMVACAALTGQLFNASEVAENVGIDHKTAQSWLSVLKASNIVHVIQPFWPNVNKRITKMPKIYFLDTGLVCHLTRWTTPDQLKCGAAAGHIFETFVVSEILKSYMNAGGNMRDVWFYRDSKKREIDVVVQDGHILHPVEIKTAATVGASAVKNFSCLEAFSDYEVGAGHVICQTKEVYPITKTVQAVPVWAI